MNPIILLIFVINLYIFLQNLFTLVFSMENYKLHKKRLKQLKFREQKSNEQEMQELLDKVTGPVITNVIPKLKIRNIEEVEKDLRMAKWSEKMSPVQYIALSLITKALGVFVFLILFTKSKFMAVAWGAILFLSMTVLLKNSAKNRREQLMMEFPDFIRIAQGYLSSGMSFTKAVTESIPFVGSEWQPILENFVIEAELKSIDSALESMAKEVDVFEVKEFVSLVRLSLEQGGNVKEGFESQAEKIQELLYDVMMSKIEQRRVYGIMIQAPLLICNLMVFGLPTISSMLNMSSM